MAAWRIDRAGERARSSPSHRSPRDGSQHRPSVVGLVPRSSVLFISRSLPVDSPLIWSNSSCGRSLGRSRMTAGGGPLRASVTSTSRRSVGVHRSGKSCCSSARTAVGLFGPWDRTCETSSSSHSHLARSTASRNSRYGDRPALARAIQRYSVVGATPCAAAAGSRKFPARIAAVILSRMSGVNLLGRATKLLQSFALPSWEGTVSASPRS